MENIILIALLGVPVTLAPSRVLLSRLRSHNMQMKQLGGEVMSFQEDSFLGKHLVDTVYPFHKVATTALEDQALRASHFTKLIGGCQQKLSQGSSPQRFPDRVPPGTPQSSAPHPCA